jgi:hypothetical protein
MVLMAATLLAPMAAALASPVVVRLRVKVRDATLLRPRCDVFVLWGLVHLRPRIRLPRHPLPDLVERLGMPFAGSPRGQAGGRGAPRRARAGSGSRTPASRHVAQGLQHAASGTLAGSYLRGGRRAVTVRRLHLSVALQAGDPARTAVAAGAAWGILGGAVAGLSAYLRFGRPPRLRVVPLFSGPARLRASLDCILAAPLGYVMVAAWRSHVRAASGRKRGDAAWASTRSRG